MSAKRRSGRGESGQAILEVALTMPLLMLLLAAGIDLGRLSQFDTLLSSGARAGAQYGSMNLITADDAPGMEAAATNDVPAMTGVTATASNFCECYGGAPAGCTATPCPGSHRLLYVTVSVTGTFHPLFSFFAYTNTSRTRTAILQVGQ